MIEDGLLEVGDPVPQVLAQLRHTADGKTRYAELCRKQRTKAAPAPSVQTSADRRLSAAPLTPADGQPGPQPDDLQD